ncbi:unnamed protein product [Discosporangium mesarthrocarpum]
MDGSPIGPRAPRAPRSGHDDSSSSPRAISTSPGAGKEGAILRGRESNDHHTTTTTSGGGGRSEDRGGVLRLRFSKVFVGVPPRAVFDTWVDHLFIRGALQGYLGSVPFLILLSSYCSFVLG